MALTIDASVGGVASNSYITLANAEIYFEKRLNADNWDAASAENKNKALANATIRIDHEDFLGLKTDVTSPQALKWPRVGMLDIDMLSILSTILPKELTEATCEMALALLTSDLQSENALTQFKSLKVDTIEIEPNLRSSNELPDEVFRLIGHFIASLDRMVRG